MNRKLKLMIPIAIMFGLSAQIFASTDIYYREPYIISPRFSVKPKYNNGVGDTIISPRFSIKPKFNTGEGELIISPRFSIKPAFNSGRTKYFYSGVFYIMDMPNLNVEVNGKLLDEDTYVRAKDKIKLSIDYSQSTMKEQIVTSKYYIRNITKSTEKDVDIVYENNKNEYELVDPLIVDDIYEMGHIATFNDNLKYDVKSIQFKVNEKGLIEFITPKGDTLFTKTVKASYSVDNAVKINTYNIYLEEYTTKTKVLVGDKLKFTDTIVETKEKETIHEFTYEIPQGFNSYEHVIEVVD